MLDGDEVVVNGRKWWSTGIGHPDCKVLVFMGLTDPDADRHHRHSMVLVPRDAPGVEGRADARHDGAQRRAARATARCRSPTCGCRRRNVIAGARRGVRDRPGPARPGPGAPLHAADRAGRARPRAGLLAAALERTAFGKPLANLGGNRERIADARIAIDQARLLVLNAAWKLDIGGPLNALSEVSQIKVAVPNMAQQVIDMAIQLHGGGGLVRRLPARRRVDRGPRAAAGRRARRGAPRRRRPDRARQVRAAGEPGPGHRCRVRARAPR